MVGLLININEQSPKSLQIQIKEKLIELIISGVLKPGMKLPSSRKLSKQLDVSRNTIIFAYQRLVDEGFIISRKSSGIYVSDELDEGGIFDHRRQIIQDKKRPGALHRPFSDQASAKSFPYPFVDTMVDGDLFPLAAWRECQRQTLSQAEVLKWGKQGPYHTDMELVEEIRSKILPGRGIIAEANEIVITSGYRGGLALLAHLARSNGQVIGMPDPMDPVTRNCLVSSGANVVSGASGQKGPVDVLCVVPNLQVPLSQKTVGQNSSTLKAGNDDITLWECDPRHTFYAADTLPPALKSSPEGKDIIYISELSPVALAGQAVGYIVAGKDLAHDLRQLQRTMGLIPVPYFQHATAIFIAQGFYDSALCRIGQVQSRKWQEMSEALLYYLRFCHVARIPNMLSFWIECEVTIDISLLIRQAAKKGVLIQPASEYFEDGNEAGDRTFCLSINAIAEEVIEEGVEVLAQTIRELESGHIETLDNCGGDILDGEEVRARMSGLNILGINSLGEPYEIIPHPDGTLTGIANRGTPLEEKDTGIWYVKDDFWIRKWDNWCYGRESASRVVIRGKVIKWYRKTGRLLDSAIIFSGK